MTRDEKISAAAKVIAGSSVLLSTNGFRDVAEAALLATGDIEPRPAKTRGAVVAEDLVEDFHGKIWFRSIGLKNGGQVIGGKDDITRLDTVREFVAERIDAERVSARDEALEEAIEGVKRAISAYVSTHAVIAAIEAIRALKSGGVK